MSDKIKVKHKKDGVVHNIVEYVISIPYRGYEISISNTDDKPSVMVFRDDRIVEYFERFEGNMNDIQQAMMFIDSICPTHKG